MCYAISWQIGVKILEEDCRLLEFDWLDGNCQVFSLFPCSFPPVPSLQNLLSRNFEPFRVLQTPRILQYAAVCKWYCCAYIYSVTLLLSSIWYTYVYVMVPRSMVLIRISGSFTMFMSPTMVLCFRLKEKDACCVFCSFAAVLLCRQTLRLSCWWTTIL